MAEMRKYEVVFVISPQLDEEARKELVEKFKNLIETSAQFENIDEWGTRKLAFPVQDFNEGYYVLIDFSAKPEFPTELERVFKITDGIIRYLVVNKEK